jgi:acetolactate synthase-1/2/3 large subunit
MTEPARVVHKAPGGELTVGAATAGLIAGIGARQAFGVVGSAIASFCRDLRDRRIEYVHCRHESGAAFAAVEASLASELPTVVFSTTGPGITNAMTGLLAARWEGARLVFVSGVTPASQRGRWAIQETSLEGAQIPGPYRGRPLFDGAVQVQTAADVDALESLILDRAGRPGGWVMHAALPVDAQMTPLVPRAPTLRLVRSPWTPPALALATL